TKLLVSLNPNDASKSGSSNIDPDMLIIVISMEYDHQRVQHERCAATKAVAKPEKNKAIAVTSGAEKGSRKGPICWKCGGIGHKRNECKNNKRKDSGSTKPKTNGSANTVETVSSDDEFAFAVEEGSDGDSLPDLQSKSDSDISSTDESGGGCADATVVDNDWFSEIDEEEVTDAEVDEDWSHVTAGLGSLSLDGMPSDGKSIPDVLGVTNYDPLNPTHVELFDSG
ncbi:hypothetical protein C0995_003320, partial [Termitomyces sp. Mi166